MSEEWVVAILLAALRPGPGPAPLDDLLTALRASPTDLARLVQRAVNRQRPGLWVHHATVTAWQTRAPEAWREASAWLAHYGIPVFVISSRPRLDAE
jgi:hypothetical protein